MINIIGLIPARSGSKRIPGKNIKHFKGKPLIAYTIAAAKESGIFDRIIVSTDSQVIADIALKYGVEVPFLRPKEYAQDLSPDFDWIKHLIHKLYPMRFERVYDCFANLRPTNPFRSAYMIRKAWKKFQENQCTSLRAVEKCRQHPAKMWMRYGFKDYITIEPILNIEPNENNNRYNMPTQSLKSVYIQNASIEIAWTTNLWQFKNVSGNIIIPFNTTGTYEGFDINCESDWILAEALVERGLVKLPEVK